MAEAPAAEKEHPDAAPQGGPSEKGGPTEKARQPGEKDYEDFDHGNFDNPTRIDNPWMPLKPGTRLVYEGSTVDDEGDEEPHRIEFTVTDLTKVIDGVRSVVVWLVDYSDGEVVEKEIAFYVQDNDGNVWLMGEYPEEYDRKEPDIKLKSYARGVGNIQVGWRGTPLEQETLERISHEQIDPEELRKVRNLAMSLEASGYEKSRDVYALTTPSEYTGTANIEITRTDDAVKVAQNTEPIRKIGDDQAKDIALKTVTGDVTAIAVEKKLGKQSIVVEVTGKDGSETDVIIDMETGQVLGTED